MDVTFRINCPSGEWTPFSSCFVRHMTHTMQLHRAADYDYCPQLGMELPVGSSGKPSWHRRERRRCSRSPVIASDRMAFCAFLHLCPASQLAWSIGTDYEHWHCSGWRQVYAARFVSQFWTNSLSRHREIDHNRKRANATCVAYSGGEPGKGSYRCRAGKRDEGRKGDWGGRGEQEGKYVEAEISLSLSPHVHVAGGSGSGSSTATLRARPARPAGRRSHPGRRSRP